MLNYCSNCSKYGTSIEETNGMFCYGEMRFEGPETTVEISHQFLGKI